MPYLAIPSAAASILKDPIVEVYIGGVLQNQVTVSTFVDTAGTEPANCTILFPLKDYLARPCSENDRVKIYINRRIRPNPIFRGYVSGFGDHLTRDSGEYVEVFAVDDVVLLNDYVVNRNFNIRDSRDELSEQLTIRDIVQYIDGLLPSTITIDSFSFPVSYPSEMNLNGVPCGTAMEQLIETSEEYKYMIRRVYTDSATVIKAFRVGYGEVAKIVRGTDREYGPQDQPCGVANVRDARREENFVDVVNSGVVLGDRKVIETALALSPAWDSTKEFMIEEPEAYATEGTEDDPNPDYDPESKRIGRAYRFSSVNTGRFNEYPELEPRLLQAPPYGYTDVTEDYCKPFLVYQFTGEGTYNVTFDFDIKDNEVMAEKPLIRDNTDTDGAIDPEFPASVWLECAYKLRSPLSVTIAKQGTLNRTIERYFQRPDFKYKYAQAYFTVGLVNSASESIGATRDIYTATYAAGPSVMVNDTTAASTWGLNRIQQLQNSRIEVTYELPRMDLCYNVGQRVQENDEVLDASITRIEYDLIARKTTVQAASR